MLNYKKIFQDYSIETEKATHGWVNIQCPWCQDTKKHLGIQTKTGALKCFKCGTHGGTATMAKVTGLPWYEIEKRYSIHNVIVERIEKHRKDVAVQFPPGTTELLDIHKQYLTERGLDPEQLTEKYKIKGTKALGPYGMRIIIPIFYAQRMVSFQGRTISKLPDVLRYKACPIPEESIHHKEILYNLDNCTNDFIVIMEGVFDVWKFGDDCAATFGTGLTSAQIKLISDKYKKAIILFDPEKNANKLAEELAISLSCMNVDVWVADLAEYGPWKDPGEVPEKDAKIIKKDLISRMGSV